MLISTIKVGRAKRGCACFCTLASESTSVLIYVLIKVRAVLFLYFKNQRAVLHFQVTRYMYKKQTIFIISYYSRLCTTTATAASTQVFKGQNIGDRSRACETRLCLFLYPYIGVDLCTDIRTDYSTYCVVLVSLLKTSELYIIFKSHGSIVLKADLSLVLLL